MESGSRPASDEGSMRLSMVRSYGTSAARIEGGMVLFMHILVLMIALMTAPAAVAQASALQATRSVKMVVLGDSLSAGLGLPASDAFPQRLQMREYPATPVPVAGTGWTGRCLMEPTR